MDQDIGSYVPKSCPRLPRLAKSRLGVDFQYESVGQGQQLVIAWFGQVDDHARACAPRCAFSTANGLNATAPHCYAMYVRGKHRVLKIHHHAVWIAQRTQFRKSRFAARADLNTR